jgi:tellurite resistance protein
MQRKDFSDEEWKTLQYGPYWAFMAVAAQDGNLDQNEKHAFSDALADPGEMKGELSREVVQSVAAEETAIFSAWEADDRSPADGFAAITKILAKVDADEANRYKGTLVWLAVRVADASGSWLGGTISHKERGAIETVATMLSFNVTDAVMATYVEDVLKALPR